MSYSYKKYWPILAVILVAAGAASVVYAITSQTQNNTNTGTIEPAVLFLAEIDGSPMDNNTNVAWDVMAYGDNAKTLNVTNVSLGNIQVWLYVKDLPSGWTATWSLNGTLIAGGSSAIGDYVVNVPDAYLEGDYGWNHTLYASQV
jgi:hypothetical protein